MLINFQKIEDLTFDIKLTFNILEVKQHTTKINVNLIRNDGYTYKIQINVPFLSQDKKHIIYNNIIYANPIIGIPPLKYFKTFINMFDYLSSNQKEGTLITETTEKNNLISANSLIKACLSTYKEFIEIDQTGSLENLDDWYYCRISDFMQYYFVDKLNESIKQLVLYNNFNSSLISKSITRSLLLMRYVGHISTAHNWKIDDLSNKVRIPDVFRTFKNPKDISSTFLDFTNCSQSKTFNEFSLKNGVILNG